MKELVHVEDLTVKVKEFESVGRVYVINSLPGGH